MKKISLLKGLALFGAAVLTSACITETILLMKNKNNGETDTKFDISTLNNYIIDGQLIGAEQNEMGLMGSLQNYGVRPMNGDTNVALEDMNDLEIISDSIDATSFILAARNYSVTYEANKSARIYFSTGTPQQLSSIITTTPDLFLDKYVDEDTTNGNILINLQTQYPSLNINELIVSNTTNLNDEKYTAQVTARTGAILYAGAVNVTYYTSGAAVLTYAQTTLAPGNSNVLPTFTFKNSTSLTGTISYTCANVAAPISFATATGAFAYANNTYYAGKLFQVKATYVVSGNTFIAYANVFAQPNDPRTLRETVFLRTGTGTFYTSFTLTEGVSYNSRTIDISAMAFSGTPYSASFMFNTQSSCLVTNCAGATEYITYWYDTTNKVLWISTRILNNSNAGITVTLDSGKVNYSTPTATVPSGFVNNIVLPYIYSGTPTSSYGTFSSKILWRSGGIVTCYISFNVTVATPDWASMIELPAGFRNNGGGIYVTGFKYGTTPLQFQLYSSYLRPVVPLAINDTFYLNASWFANS